MSRDKIAVYAEEGVFENGVHFNYGIQALQATPDALRAAYRHAYAPCDHRQYLPSISPALWLAAFQAVLFLSYNNSKVPSTLSPQKIPYRDVPALLAPTWSDDKYARQPPCPPQDMPGAGLPFPIGDLLFYTPFSACGDTLLFPIARNTTLIRCFASSWLLTASVVRSIHSIGVCPSIGSLSSA